MTADRVPQLVDHLFRHEAGRMVARLTRWLGGRNLDLAEEAVQDALIAALQRWPFGGVPERPAAWLMEVARNRALDRVRREAALRARSDALADTAAQTAEAAWGTFHRPDAGGAPLPDDELCLMFMSSDPAIPRESRVALTLKTLCGFSVPEIARAFLAPEATVAQRLVRAKRLVREGRVEMALPSNRDLSLRLDSVLEVVYLLFNEGYAAHGGDALVRHDLCTEALRLGRLLVRHPLTGVPTTHALVALMCLHSARLPARVSEGGELFVLGVQDRSLWDRGLVARGFAHLERAAEGATITPYHVQAAIAACHAAAPSYSATDWAHIVELYDRLLELSPSPVAALNRAVAISRLRGPREGLDALAPLARERALRGYYLLAAVEGHLRQELGERDHAASCYRAALACRCTEPERRFLRGKLEEVAGA